MTSTPDSSGLASPALSSSIMSASPLHPRSSRGYRFSTLCTTVDNPDADHRDQHGSSSVPIYQTATFKGMGGAYDYTRSGNPSRTFLEHHIAKISSARHAFAVSSGMGALDVILRLLKPGDEIISGNDLYGGSNRLLAYLRDHAGVHTHHVDTTSLDSIQPLLDSPGSRVRMVLLESPTNPLLQIADIERIAAAVHEALPDALVVVDNTMMSPYLMRPLEVGADLAYDSGTKYLSGHHDLMAGVVTCNRADLANRLAFIINSVGNGLAPFDCFLLLRGVKTLAIRFDRQQASAMAVARRLSALGFKVNYPGLEGHPGKAVHDRLAKGPGAVLSFETGDKDLSNRILGAARLWGISVSFGCVNSLISMPCLMSHASIDPAVRAARNLPEDLIRLCVGIEDTEDLLDDLEGALLEAGAVRVIDEGASGPSRLERVVSTAPVAADAQTGYMEGEADTEARARASQTAAAVAAPRGPFLTSAPGKVILFGEHAVVHGVTAIAGSVDLRCYCLHEPLSNSKVAISMPDVGLEASWDLEELPWDKVDDQARIESLPDRELVALLGEKAGGAGASQAAAAQAFLYMYMNISPRGSPCAAKYTIRSALPIGAGLGSSAAYSVSLVASLLYARGALRTPAPATQTRGQALPSRGVVPEHDAKLVNDWAFVCEKILHGNPSGVDNSVATLGGALAFTKASPGRAAVMDSLRGFKSIRFLLTDTKVPRNTKSLVAGVAARKSTEPDIVNALLTEIQTISDEARRWLSGSGDNSGDGGVDRKEQVRALEALVLRNHDALRSLGVSHEALEAIKRETGKEGFGLCTKLTGAGGGGCAVTIIPDDFPEEKLERVKAELEANGFKCYETNVGGSGFGVLVPSAVSGGAGADCTTKVPEQKLFREMPTGALVEWAEQALGWAYV